MNDCASCIFFNAPGSKWACSKHRIEITNSHEPKTCSTSVLVGNQCIHCGGTEYKTYRDKLWTDPKYPGIGIIVFQFGEFKQLAGYLKGGFVQCANCHLKYVHVPHHSTETVEVIRNCWNCQSRIPSNEPGKWACKSKNITMGINVYYPERIPDSHKNFCSWVHRDEEDQGSCDFCGKPIRVGDIAHFPLPAILVCPECYNRRVAAWERKRPGQPVDFKILFRLPGEKREPVQRRLI